MSDSKWCPDCERDLPLTDFQRYRTKRYPDGRVMRMCKTCRGARRRGPAGDGERARSSAAKRRKYATDSAYRESVRRVNVKSRYGISLEDVAEMLVRQGGGCAVCRRPDPGGKGQWHIDHAHGHCGKNKGCPACVRGILCQECNLALGHMQDDPQRLLAAARYLLSGQSPTG